jgi:hypothetical protein
MRAITYEQFLAGAGLNLQRVKMLRRHDYAACAFGRREILKGLGYIELDCVAPLLVDALYSVFPMKFAAELVRVHADTWTMAVAAAEHTDDPVFFTIVEFMTPEGQRTHTSRITDIDDPYQIVVAATKEAGMPAVRSVAVNMKGILADVRKNARKARVDLSTPFLPHPDDPRLAEILAPYVEERDKAGILARALVEAQLPEGAQPN